MGSVSRPAWHWCATAIESRHGIHDEQYFDAFARYGIDAFVPTDEEQRTTHGLIFPHLQGGIVLPEEKSAVLQIARQMVSEWNADALILG